MPNLSMGSWIKMLVCALDEVANGFCEFKMILSIFLMHGIEKGAS